MAQVFDKNNKLKVNEDGSINVVSSSFLSGTLTMSAEVGALSEIIDRKRISTISMLTYCDVFNLSVNGVTIRPLYSIDGVTFYEPTSPSPIGVVSPTGMVTVISLSANFRYIRFKVIANTVNATTINLIYSTTS